MDDRTPLISVIVPSYNYERFLRSCVGSIVRQTQVELEIVIVDDGSTDGSIELLRNLVTESSFVSAFKDRITLSVNEKNLGAHATINRAIQLSRGEYVAIVNADDEFVPGRLSTLLKSLRKANADLAFSAVEFIDEHGSNIDTRPDPLIQQLRRRQLAISSFPSAGFACLASNVAVSTGNLFFRRALFDRIGPFTDLRFCHDWAFLLQSVLVSEPLFVADTSYRYRVHGSNTFRSLGNVAASESGTVYRGYFDRLILNRHSNARAPGPAYWPGVFEVFMSAFGLWCYWPGGKPIDK